MLLVIGAVTKGHFQISGATVAGGIAVVALSFVLPERCLLPSASGFCFPVQQSVFCLGLIGVIAGVLQLLLYSCMLKSHGWRPEDGERRTVWACQYCMQQFPTFEEAAAHEQICPKRMGPGDVSNIVGVPMGGAQPMATPMGQVVSQQAAPSMGQQYGMPASMYAPPVAGAYVGGQIV
jgi:hypothetical protein